MDLNEALGIAAHLRKHAMPAEDDESIAARQIRTVLALADAVESLRTRNERLGLLRLEAESRLERLHGPALAASLAWADPTGVEDRVRSSFSPDEKFAHDLAAALDHLTEALNDGGRAA